MTDEELALLGAPWAKEGLLQRKHYWEMTGKRAKDKSWSQVFVVISAGELKMFRFDGSGGSMRGGAGVGGGDWTVRVISSCTVLHTSLTPVSAGERVQRRLDLADTRSLLLDAASRLQPRPPALLRPYNAEWRFPFLPSWHARPRRRVGVDVQLLGGASFEGAVARRSLEHGVWLEPRRPLD